MKPARQWTAELADLRVENHVAQEQSRDGMPTLRVRGILLHSRYNPREEAARLIESAGLDPARPVLVIGLGLGYHVLELTARGMSVAVVEPDVCVAKLALDGPLRETETLIGIGDPDAIIATPPFQEFVARLPQVFAHPATVRLYPEFAEAIESAVIRKGLASARMSVAVVGPMYGGSLPIAGYLERAFCALGHRTLLVDNSAAWTIHEVIHNTVNGKRPSRQLADYLVGFLGEWSYARVAEFAPEICIVLAQAPVPPTFPDRLRGLGIVSAFWFIENWRHLDYWRAIAPHYDFFFHIQPGEFEDRLTELGCRHHAYVQTGCDPEVHRPVELAEADRIEYECDVSFAGAGYPNRNHLFAGLTDYNLAIWGINWRGKELLRHVRRPDEWFSPETFAKIVAGSKINLNLHSSATSPGVDPACDAVNPRVFEIAACGGFQVCDPCKGLERLFDFETELPVYRDLADLRRLIDYYLAHPEERRVIAERARARVLREHTYAQRAQQMLDLILDRHGGRILRRGVRVQRTVAEVIERVGRDSSLGRYLQTLPPDLLFTYENVVRQLAAARSEVTFPEAVFMFLRDLRDTAEKLLEDTL